MCYAGCRYELTWGEGAGECSLPNGEKPPIDAMCAINDLHAENAKLREEIAKWERLAASIDLPEYPVTQFKPKDLERENAKLRELVRHLMACVRNKDCDTCPYMNEPCDFCRDMQELGIEVD